MVCQVSLSVSDREGFDGLVLWLLQTLFLLKVFSLMLNLFCNYFLHFLLLLLDWFFLDSRSDLRLFLIFVGWHNLEDRYLRDNNKRLSDVRFNTYLFYSLRFLLSHDNLGLFHNFLFQFLLVMDFGSWERFRLAANQSSRFLWIWDYLAG